MATTEHFILNIFLYDIEPKIWRKFSVPADYTFEQVHQSIQKAMGWLDLQQHEFLHGKGKKLDQLIGSDDNDHANSPFFQNEKKVVLSDFIGRKKLPLRILYRYDLTEDWIHEIVIESKEVEESNKPIFIDGARACPIEDSGGPWEYKSCLEGESQWMEDDYDPEVFDPKKVKF